MTNYEIRTVKSDNDIMGISGCAYITWHNAYDELLPKGQVDYMIKKYQSFDVIKQDILKNGYNYYIAESNNKVIAFCGIKPELDKLFISKIYVLPKWQRHGIASSLFQTVVSDFATKYNTFYLTVNKNNTKAISVYKSFGFDITDTVVTDIGGGYVMDDYIMEYTI